MAEVFKNNYLDVTSTAQQIYAAPAGKTAVVVSLRVTNVDGSASDSVTVEVVDSDTTTKALIASTILVPADSTLSITGQDKLVLETGDKIEITGVAASGDLEAFISVLEIDN
tara:strand:+ start:292 stop:627 length:336 start_codon:yes stop_codon:yes gene_type:complete